jgi:hypothetical protein
MGFELRSVLASGRRPFGAYRKECNRSPSAQDAAHTVGIAWQGFSTLAAFRASFRRDLLRALLQVGPALGLDMDDVERLMRDPQAEGEESAGQDTRRRPGTSGQRGGAGRSGRILGREVWQAEEQD